MPTPWTPRTPPTTAWGTSRLGGSYLLTKAGEYVTDVLGRRIIVKVPGGTLSKTEWTPRTPI